MRPHHGLEDREQLEDLVGDLPLAARHRAEAGLQVLLDRQQREDLAALRHDGDPAPRPLDRRQAGDVLAVPQDLARRGPHLADHGAQRAGLADTVAAEHAGDLARSADSETPQSAWLAP